MPFDGVILQDRLCAVCKADISALHKNAKTCVGACRDTIKHQVDEARNKRHYAKNKEKHRLSNLRWLEENREKSDQYQREYRAKHHDKIKAYQAQWRLDNRDRKSESGRLRRIKKLENLANCLRPDRCDICKTVGHVDYDHDHASGKFRGWLCRRCNIALGMAGDSVDRLLLLIRYLEFGRHA